MWKGALCAAFLQMLQVYFDGFVSTINKYILLCNIPSHFFGYKAEWYFTNDISFINFLILLLLFLCITPRQYSASTIPSLWNWCANCWCSYHQRISGGKLRRSGKCLGQMVLFLIMSSSASLFWRMRFPYNFLSHDHIFQTQMEIQTRQTCQNWSILSHYHRRQHDDCHGHRTTAYPPNRLIALYQLHPTYSCRIQ